MNFLNLNIHSEINNDADFLILFNKFGTRPNKIVIHDMFTAVEFEKIIQPKSEENILSELIPVEDGYITNEKVFVELENEIWCSYIRVDKNSDNYIIDDVSFYFKDLSKEPEAQKLIAKLYNCVIDYGTNNINKFSTIRVGENSMDLEPVNIDIESIEIDNRYSEKTIKKVDKLIKKIKKTERGISIFSGDRGLGKTTMSKYLANKIDRMVLFIPNNMIDITINNPEFSSFLSKFEKLLIIIDDCEVLCHNQFVKISNFSNNINQLVDGFLAETLNIHFLLIFNDEESIDDNLIDSNSFITNIYFDYLEPGLATDLSKNLKFNKKYKEPTRLVDIVKNNKNEKSDKIGL